MSVTNRLAALVFIQSTVHVSVFNISKTAANVYMLLEVSAHRLPQRETQRAACVKLFKKKKMHFIRKCRGISK